MPGTNRITKHTVLSSGLHDADIRPPALLNEFKRLSLEGAATYFGTPNALEKGPCPACGVDDPESAYEKDGYHYVRCMACESLYVNPRPTSAALARYYNESEASQFRAAQFAEDTAPQRRFHLLHSLASWMGQLVEESGLPANRAYGDVETYTPSLFDEVAELNCFGTLHTINARHAIAGHCAAPVESCAIEDLPPLGVISAFEKLEHQQNPEAFLQQLHAGLIADGLLFLTTRTSSGFDLQMLGEKAPYIFVPEHLNLLSIDGLGRLLQRSGFELIELSTPGQLDVEMVIQACASDPNIVLPPFAKTLLLERDRHAHGDFQAFLQKHRLSSHVRIAARKHG